MNNICPHKKTVSTFGSQFSFFFLNSSWSVEAVETDANEIKTDTENIITDYHLQFKRFFHLKKKM